MMPRKFALLFASVFCVGGCTASIPGCSLPDAQNLVKQISQKELGKNGLISGFYDVAKSRFDLDNIRTEKTSDSAIDCASDITVHFAWAEILAKKGAKEVIAGPTTINYHLQLTDDGKLYATVDN